MVSLPAFCYPTTVAWVDDDDLFLAAASGIFKQNEPVKSFNDPQKALKILEQYSPPILENSFLHGSVNHDLFETIDHAPVDFNVTKIHELQNQLSTADEISVLIVDYKMPGMNGIELCQLLKGLPFKKILLTGEAELHHAVTAFNNNIIDRFIPKDSPTLFSDIQFHVSDLKQRYFQNKSQAILSHLEVDNLTALSDPVFIGFFQDYCVKNEIKESYLIDKIGSFLLINKKHQKFNFVLHTDASLSSLISVYQEIAEAQSIIDIIKKREKIPFFGIGKESWQLEIDEVLNSFYPLNIIQGRQVYYWTLVEANLGDLQ